MPSPPFEINFTGTQWDCRPPHRTFPRAEGASFHNTEDKPCLICFGEAGIFGIESMVVTPHGIVHLGFLASTGMSGFSIQDMTQQCAKEPKTEPFDVTIGSKPKP